MKTMGDYHDLYLKCDVLLSADVFEKFRNTSLNFFFEKGMRGRVSYISKRYNKVNNKYLKSYDPNQNQNIL